MTNRTKRTLEGQVALVTGGGKGLGRAIALALGARGVAVLVTGREERALGDVVGEIANGGGKARHLAGDVRDPSHLRAAVAKAIDALGGLDIAIAAAGLSVHLPLGAENPTNAAAIVNTNLMGAYYTFDAAAHAMKGPGRLLAVGRARGKVDGPGYVAYRASQAALVGLVRATAEELAPRAITCNALSAETPDAEPEELAQLAVFLCTSGGLEITGQSVSIGG